MIDETNAMPKQDGFPRNVPQAEAFQKVAQLDLVVNIDLPQWILADKISGRRYVGHQSSS